MDAYKLIREEEIKDISSKGVLLSHKKTGAHIALIINDDNNKVFDIAFRTPPKDSTGVAHITEHTVLCGSEKYPLKDPFVELAKGSLNTFLNAMTYPDKTMYPVASCNDADFRNLIDVYLDAVFFPNIYKTEKIFRQEGWHYHLEDMNSPLFYNGVVYNEMKGVYSSPDSILESVVMSSLFPDSIYGLESGGDPDSIPDLTYGQYLDFHRTYYHPSNSYIFLYGNMDMRETLDYIDKEYLSRFDKKEINSEIGFQRSFESMKKVTSFYPVLDDEPLEDNTYIDMSIAAGEALDVFTCEAMNVLTYVLLDAPGAPLKQALLDANIGKDISGAYNDGILQHVLSVTADYANAEDSERFEEVINKTLYELSEQGLDEKAIRAAINYFEFRFREADFSIYPKGLIYIMSAFDSWLYDENHPFDYLKLLGVFDELKKKIGTGFYEGLIRDLILNNPHKVLTVLRPKRGLSGEKESKLSEKLGKYKAGLSEDELKSIINETSELIRYQRKEDSPEALSTLPVLRLEDIDKKTPVILKTDEYSVNSVTLLHHEYETGGISYLNLMFELKGISEEMMPYVSLLSSVLGYVDTKNFSYSELSNEINSRTGGINCGISMYTDKSDKARMFFTIKSKYLDPECSFALRMIHEIIFESLIEKKKRLSEILANRKAALQDEIPQNGHISAVTRAASGISLINNRQERIFGISYYRFIEQLFKNFEEEYDTLAMTLESLKKTIFGKDNLTVSLTSDAGSLKRTSDAMRILLNDLPETKDLSRDAAFVPFAVRDGIMTSGQVQYVASVGNFKNSGYEYSGVLRVLRTMLNYDYLWANIRVTGGAYGCMSMFKRTGDMYLVSYRDPNLKNTFDVFDNLAEFIENFDADDSTMAKLIIGTISNLDTPMNAKAKGETALSAYFCELTQDDFQKERNQILDVTAEDIRKLKDLLADSFDGSHICVLGSEASIRKNEKLFDHVESFIQA